VEDATNIRRHLEACSECAAQWQKLQAVMAAVEPAAVPERDESYGAQVWQQVRYRLPEKREAEWTSGWTMTAWRQLFRPQRLAYAGGFAAIILAAFLAGRMTQAPPPGPNVAEVQQQQKDRVLLVAVGSHLERSQMVLIELINAEPGTSLHSKLNIAEEQAEVRDLLTENRLYRQTAQASGNEPAVNAVLTELERVLVEIANGPSEIDAKQLDVLRKQIQSQGILLKVRIIGDKVREKQKPATQNLGEKQRET
jgi:hypothetical protein